MRIFRIALAQMNATVGDLSGNTARILSRIDEARGLGVDLVAFPELAITGYPPEDLVLKPSFIRANRLCLERIAEATAGITAVVGFVDDDGDIYNAAALLHDGSVADVHRKMHLPNYGVFDENRYFRAGAECSVVRIGETRIGVNVCEDIWHPSGPAQVQAEAGAELIVNINASPFQSGKALYRHHMLRTRATDNLLVVAYVNMVGGQDELVFDGNSLVVDQNGALVAEGSQFRDELVVADVDLGSVFRQRLHDPRRRQSPRGSASEWTAVEKTVIDHASERRARPAIPQRAPALFDEVGEIYEALVLGVRDYVEKNGFHSVLIGLSGGIDSSLTAVVAADALGPERVVGVSMPSRYSSEGSSTDAEDLAGRLGIRYMQISIEEAFSASLSMMEPALVGTEPGLAEENLQARIRGNILMTLSNKFGHLVLTTGNKSEMATGYSTLYGDMAGGLAVIKDVPKTLVYRLSHYRNARGDRAVIPEAVLRKPPSAELRPDQRDDDSLPPYDVLDPILKLYVEDDRSLDEIVELGHEAATVQRIIGLVDHSEYKRRQAPPGIKVTPRAFGRDRRLPITNRYKEET
ncbi:MAG: synthase [Chloroflexi bacterium]|nr:synthase [Chloroflexota bacterium]